MGAQLRVFRRRIRSVQATKKITKAMELIASSRIVKAQQRLDASMPYLTQLVDAVSAAASHASDVSKHPLTAKAEKRLLMSELGITPPNFARTLSVADEFGIRVDIVAREES